MCLKLIEPNSLRNEFELNYSHRFDNYGTELLSLNYKEQYNIRIV